jgi:CMP/dCMP kinase
MHFVIAVDGPSGSGKSTVSRAVAQRLGLRYLDTGAMYRAVTWWLLENGVDVSDPAVVGKAAGSTTLTVDTDPVAPLISISNVDVTTKVRSAEVTAAVSAVSAVPAIRRWLVNAQRRIIADGAIVVEGRDIGTVVAPEATTKVYLTADANVRAQRRVLDAATPDRSVTRALAALRRRDQSDSTRSVDPLTLASDAHQIDATSLSASDVAEMIVALVHEVAADSSAVRR